MSHYTVTVGRFLSTKFNLRLEQWYLSPVPEPVQCFFKQNQCSQFWVVFNLNPKPWYKSESPVTQIDGDLNMDKCNTQLDCNDRWKPYLGKVLVEYIQISRHRLLCTNYTENMMISWHGKYLFITVLVMGIHRSPIDSHHKEPAIRSFTVFAIFRLNKMLRKQPSRPRFEMSWCLCDLTLMRHDFGYTDATPEDYISVLNFIFVEFYSGI